MQSFKIGDTEFGLDRSTLGVKLLSYESGETRIDFGFEGNGDVFEALTSEEDSPWSWALRPPSLFMHEVLVPPSLLDQGGEIHLSDQSRNEFGLYFMEYAALERFTLKLVPGRSIEINGQADIWGRHLPFCLRCDEAEWDIRSGLETSAQTSPAYPPWKRVRDWIYEKRWLFVAIAAGIAAAALQG